MLFLCVCVCHRELRSIYYVETEINGCSNNLLWCNFVIPRQKSKMDQNTDIAVSNLTATYRRSDHIHVDISEPLPPS